MAYIILKSELKIYLFLIHLNPGHRKVWDSQKMWDPVCS